MKQSNKREHSKQSINVIKTSNRSKQIKQSNKANKRAHGLGATKQKYNKSFISPYYGPKAYAQSRIQSSRPLKFFGELDWTNEDSRVTFEMTDEEIDALEKTKNLKKMKKNDKIKKTKPTAYVSIGEQATTETDGTSISTDSKGTIGFRVMVCSSRQKLT